MTKSIYGHLRTRFGEATGWLDANGCLTGLRFGAWTHKETDGHVHDDEALAFVERQLAEYGNGERMQFDLPLAPKGTVFQQEVWQALQQIPFGTTVSYGELAARLGKPNAARAVGRANATNPIWLVVPCHRVIGSGGSLTGYAGGLALKQAILQFEQAQAPFSLEANGRL